jgi:hypothetical protein
MYLIAAAWMALFTWSLLWAQTPKAVIEGIVVNAATKAPIAGASLRLAGKAEELLNHGRTDVEPIFTRSDAAGRFAFESLQPDLFILQIRSPGVAPIGMIGGMAFVDLRVAPGPPTYTSGNGPETAVERFTDPDGNLRAKVTIALSYYATIDGKVTSPDGRPMEGCTIEMYRQVPPGLSERQKDFALRIPGTQTDVFRMSGLTLNTNDQGEFHAAHLESGTYYVKENCSEYGRVRLWRPGYWETFYREATHIEFAAPIRVAPGEHARADIRISAVKGIQITGALANTGQDTWVVIVPTDNFNSRFFPGVVVGNRYIVENVPPGRYLLTALNRSESTAASRRIDVSDHNMDGVDLALQPFSDLAGTVKFAEGCTAGPVKITLFTMPTYSVEARSDGEGRFVLRHVPPFRFGIEASGSQRSTDVFRIRLGDEVGRAGSIRFGPALNGESLEIEMPCGDTRRPQ